MDEAKRYRKLPIEVEAFRYEDAYSIPEGWHKDVETSSISSNLCVFTLHGITYVRPGTWIVRTPEGGAWPVADKVFRQSYEEI